METKKNPVHNLEKRFSLRFFAGLAVAVSVTLVAFEWRTPFEEEIVFVQPEDPGILIDIIPPTKVQEEIKKKPELPKLQPKVILPTDQIKVVDNTVAVKTDSLVLADVDSTPKLTPTPPDLGEQTDPPVEEIFVVVEEMPRFKCQDDKDLVLSYIAKHVKYPRIALENNITGTTHVTFVVDKTGKVVDAEVVKGFDRECDKEALRVIKSLPDYCPGMQRNKPVSVRYTLPVKFVIGR